MNKTEIVEKMARDAGITKTAAKIALNVVFECIKVSLTEKDGEIRLKGFGTFKKTRREARKCRNPQTGEAIKIKATNVVKFKAGKKLKDNLGGPGGGR